MKRNFIEVTLEAGPETGELLGLLDDSGFLGSWEEDGVLRIYWPQEIWSDAVLENIQKTLTILGAKDLRAEPTVAVVEDRDWNAAWAASLQPIRLGRRIRIRQSWHPTDPSFEGIELVVDPKRAFGTGHHATTRMVLEWLEENIKGAERVLDIGTGSGILSMAAIRLGAATALAVDIDDVALECARQYAAYNGFSDEIEFRTASFEDLGPETHDVVLANIDGRTLPLLCSHLSRLLKRNGVACFSGLQHQDYEDISRALKEAGFRIAAHRQRDEWVALEITASLNVKR